MSIGDNPFILIARIKVKKGYVVVGLQDGDECWGGTTRRHDRLFNVPCFIFHVSLFT